MEDTNISQNSSDFDYTLEDNTSNGIQNPDANAGSVDDKSTETSQVVDEELSQAKDYETIARIMQSRHDKLAHSYKKLESDYLTAQSRAELLEQVTNDPLVRKAFIRELEPDLISEPDIEEYVETNLKKEFGDFYPDDEIAKQKPWSKDAKYYKRASQLTEDFEKDVNNRILPLQQLKEERKLKEQQQQEQNQKLMNDLMGEFKVPTEFVNEFFSWAQGLEPKTLFQIYYKGIRKIKSDTNNNLLSNKSGNGNSPMSNLGRQSNDPARSFVKDFLKR